MGKAGRAVPCPPRRARSARPAIQDCRLAKKIASARCKIAGADYGKPMAEPKKKPVASSAMPRPSPPGTEPAPPAKAVPAPPEHLLSREELELLSPLQLVDMITAKLPPRHVAILDMVYLRDRVEEMEEINDQARQTIEKLDAVVEKLRAPAFRVGTFLMAVEPDKAHVCAGGTDYVCRLDPQMPAGQFASRPARSAQRGLCRRARAGLRPQRADCAD